MKLNLSEIMAKLQADEKELEKFLALLSLNYRYELNQVLLLYSQGYTVEEDLCGYTYAKAHNLIAKRYTCLVNGQSVYLYPVKRVVPNRRNISEQARMASTAMNVFKSHMSLDIVHADIKGYEIDGYSILLDSRSPENVLNCLVQASLDIRSQEFSSLFCKDLVEFMWFGGKLKNFDVVVRLAGKDFYDLLNSAFNEFKHLYFLYDHKYFTINEVAILNQCYKCRRRNEVMMMLKGISGVNMNFLSKLQNLRDRDFESLLRTISKGQLLNYPEYKMLR